MPRSYGITNAAPYASAPPVGSVGDTYYNTTSKTVFVSDGTSWNAVSGGVGLTSVAPSTQAIGDSATVGVGTAAARDDHKHAMPAFGTVTQFTSFSASKVDGTATTVSHSDHNHGSPPLAGATPGAQTIGAAGTAGSGALPAAYDHVHPFANNVADPTTASQVASKQYVDLLDGGTKTGGFYPVANAFYRLNAASNQGNLAIYLPAQPPDRTRIAFYRQDSWWTNSFWVITAGSGDSVGGALTRNVGSSYSYLEITYIAATSMWTMTRREQNSDPLVAQDIATKQYVDLIDGGTQTGSFTVVANTFYRLNAPASSGPFTATLPTSPADRTRVGFYRQDNNFFSTTWTIAAAGGNTIVGGTTNTTWNAGGQHSYVELIYIAATTNWIVTQVGYQGLPGLNYATNGNAFAPSIMVRDGSGRSQVSDPATAQDIASKNYVDGPFKTITAASTAATDGTWNRATVLIDATNNNVAITALPVTSGNLYWFKRVDSTANTVTITSASGTIDGDANLTLVGQYAACELQADGTNLRVVGNYGSASAPALQWARMGSNSGTAVGASGALAAMGGWTVMEGNRNGFAPTMAGGVLTFIQSGLYMVTARIGWASTSDSGARLQLRLTRGDGAFAHNDLTPASASRNLNQEVAWNVYIASGQTLEVDYGASYTTAPTVASGNQSSDIGHEWVIIQLMRG